MNQTQNLKCPFCQGTNVAKPKHSPKAFAISVLLLGFPLFFKKNLSFCFDCSKDFKVKS
jgi:hypothetical protein